MFRKVVLPLLVAIPLLADSARAQSSGGVQAEGGPAAAEGVIQPGDQVTLRIFREPELSGQFTVSEVGSLVLPRLGSVQVAEMTVSALQTTLAERYAEFLRNPAIEITVLRRIGIQGEVRRPDVYMLDPTVTLRDALARAGGITEAGHPGRIMIVRGDELIELGADPEARFRAAELRSGDQIVVGRRSWTALNPAVAVSTATGLISFVIGIVLLVR
jgi:protein involved in polysaccharide export with SLBB domain